MKWKFAESDADGEAWMRSPGELHGFVDLQSTNGEWRRLMVVTKAWVLRQLDTVDATAGGTGRAVFASMLVLPDAQPAQLRGMIDAAIRAGGLEHFASSSAE